MGTNGSAITTANSGSSGNTALDSVIVNGSGASIVYTNTRSAHGTLAARITPVDAQTAYIQYGSSTNPLNVNEIAARAYVYFSSLPTQSTGILFFYNTSAARVISLHLDSTGHLYARGAGATTLWTASAVFPVNQWVRVEIRATIGSTGSIDAAYYANDSTTAIDAQSLTGVDCGTAQVRACALGKQSNTNYAASFDVDDFAVETAPNGTMIGPWAAANVAPVVNAGVDQANIEPWGTVTLTGVATDSDGTIASTSWTQISGQTVTLSGSGLTRTFTAPATLDGVTLGFRFSATDNLGVASTDDVTATILPATEFHRQGNVWVPIRFDLL